MAKGYETIRRKHAEDVKKQDKNYDAIANEIWNKLNDNERHGIRFGLFPAWIDKEYKMEHGVTVALLRVCDKKLGMVM